MFQYLTFSDAAKYADIARNLVSGLGYGNSFTFWSNSLFDLSKYDIFPAISVPPVMPFSIAAFFKLLGVSDVAVIATSVFYFLLTLIFVFLLAKKIFKSNLVGVLSTIVVGFNQDLINYATNGASESPFIFEIVAAMYFVSLKKEWGNLLAFVFLILLYFTRPQAFIYIAGIILFWLFINFKIRTALIYFVIISVVGFLVDKFILGPLSGKYFLYSIIGRGLGSSFNQSSTASDALRGGTDVVIDSGIVQLIKNVFYNLYNFFKLLPQIMSPYLFALFTVGIFIPPSRKATEGQVGLETSFKIASVFMVAVTLLVAAASIPFFRYLHPVVPLVYIIAVGTLVEIIGRVNGVRSTEYGENDKKLFTVHSSQFTVTVSLFLILLFGVGQTLGILLLDSRFEKNIHNTGKPPVYIELSKILKENTKPTDMIVTNLDTWGSWYGERKTVWFPLEPKHLINPATGKVPFDAIYLTSYKIDDANYYMGDSWRMIFENPNDPEKWVCDGCAELAKEFSLKNIYMVSADDNYERQDSKAVLLVRK